MISGIFISGTGTDVGKTVMTAGLLRWLRRHRGEANGAMVMKPVQTGCAVDGAGRLHAPDVEFVLRATGMNGDADANPETPAHGMDAETLAHLAPYCFAPACSPHLAARMAGQRIEIDRILSSARWLAGRYRRLVVEGAGGLAVPLNESQTMLDLICELHLPVLLVGRSGLGTINHTLLSLEALRRRGCEVIGVMLNDTQPVAESESYIHQDNVCAVEHFGKVCARRIPYLPFTSQGSASGPALDFAALDSILDQCGFLRECLL